MFGVESLFCSRVSHPLGVVHGIDLVEASTPEMGET